MAFQDFDLITERRRIERKEKIRKRITIGVVLGVIIIAGVIAAVIVNLNNNQDDDDEQPKENKSDKKSDKGHEVSKSSKLVKTMCASTDYKATCESSLAKAAHSNPNAQPKDLLKAAISVVEGELDKAMKQSEKLNLDTPEKRGALDVCKKVIGDAREELTTSVTAVTNKDMTKISSKSPDLDSWLSAVMSYQQTCIDAMPEGEEKTTVKKAFKSASELTSNSLAIVSHVSSILSSIEKPKRRLMSDVKASSLDDDELPTWMSYEDRRMLKVDVPKQPPNAVVAKDGSGQFASINAALAKLPPNHKGRYIIYVKEGVYDENVVITKQMVNITMYGDGSQKSIITGNKNFVDGVRTFLTASFAAEGEGFMAQALGFRNTAGPEKHQAVAIRVQSDRSIFLNCRMEGYQDTLYAQTHRQFYRGCYITGTIDFIFGDAAAIFQNCMIYVRKPMDNQQNIVTAQGRYDKHETTGFVLQNCHIMADDKLMPEKARFKSYLGRPWKEFSRTIIMETEIDDLIDPQGWMPWQGNFALSTLYYAEFNNKGPGADVKGRVTWPGHKVIKREEAVKYTVGQFIQGETWLKGDYGVAIPVRFTLSA